MGSFIVDSDGPASACGHNATIVAFAETTCRAAGTRHCRRSTHVRAFAVHIFTALGAALAFGALTCGPPTNWTVMFGCLGIALIVDGIDGTLARRVSRRARCCRAGRATSLDLVVDFVDLRVRAGLCDPASGLLPPLLDIPAGLSIVITGALYFADRNMKTATTIFAGFRRCGTRWRSICLF